MMPENRHTDVYLFLQSDVDMTLVCLSVTSRYFSFPKGPCVYDSCSATDDVPEEYEPNTNAHIYIHAH